MRDFHRLLALAQAVDKTLPAIRFHDLRHSAATLALGAGIHPKVVSEMLGHSKISITLDLYSHVTHPMRDDAARKIEDTLRGT